MLKGLLTTMLLTACALNAGHSEKQKSVSNKPLKVEVNAPATNGLNYYAAFANQAAVTTGSNVLFAGANELNSTHIMAEENGSICIQRPGVYFVQYTVRFSKTSFNGTSTAVAQLQQTVDGVPTNITQAAVTSNSAVDAATAGTPASQTQVTGFALVNVTSKANNDLNLAVTFDNGFTLPATTGSDANAEIVLFKIN